MKLFGIIVLSAMLLVSCKNNQSPVASPDTLSNIPVKDTTLEENPYPVFRSMLNKVTNDTLQISLPAEKTIVYGVVMDWEMEGGTVTMPCFQTGDVSLYMSTGGAIIGGSGHESVTRPAKEVVVMAQSYLDIAVKEDSLVMPVTGGVYFHLLTNKGKFLIKETYSNLENLTSTLTPLFSKANDVISALREVSEARLQEKK